jgi:hypothetical protein
MSDEKEITLSEIGGSETKREEIEDFKSGTAVKGMVKYERQTSGETDGETEKTYPKGLPFIILTIALMGTVFVAGLDQNVLGALNALFHISK